MEIGIRDACITDCGRTDLLACASELGVDRVELLVDPKLSCPALQLSLVHNERRQELLEQLNRHGVHVCALLLMTDFCASDGMAQIDWVIAAIELAQSLGIPAVRIDPHTPDRSLSPQFVADQLTTVIRRILLATPSSTVDLALENHAYLSNDPAFLESVFSTVNSNRLGLTLDTGNFYWFGFPLEEVYAIIERFAAKVKHTHIKNIHYPPEQAHQRRPIGLDYKDRRCPLDEGDLDLSRIATLLRAANYRRTLCIENESLSKFPMSDRLNVLKRDVAALKRL